MDDYTRANCIFFMCNKYEVVLHVRRFITMAKTQFDSFIIIMRSDNDLEFVNDLNKEMLYTRLRIVHQTSCVHTPQQNGVVERTYKHLLEVARALKLQEGVPSKYWRFCVLTSCYVINIMHSTVLKEKTPYDMLYCKKFNPQHLHVFSSLCFATILHRKDKLGLHFISAVFLGYSNT